MKVRYCSGDGYKGLAIGDVGLVRNNVCVDWSRNTFVGAVYFEDIELLN